MEIETLSQKRKKTKGKFLWIACVVAALAVIVLEVVLLCMSVSNRKNNGGVMISTEAPEKAATAEPTATPEPTEEPFEPINEEGTTILTRFNVPKGYTRVAVEKGSFGEYLQNYTLKAYGESAYTYTGAVSTTASTAGVFQQQDNVIRAQQCADTAIMLYAEYLYSQERYDEISFKFSSGFDCDFNSWASGKRDLVNGNKVTWVDKAGTGDVKADDYSYENFYNYLKEIYVYANTDSLSVQCRKITEDELEPGCILVATMTDLKAAAKEVSDDLANDTTLGHAMIVADVAVNEEGEKIFLLVEGTTPATECSVVETPTEIAGYWFKFDENGRFVKSSSGIEWRNSWLYSFY